MWLSTHCFFHLRISAFSGIDGSAPTSALPWSRANETEDILAIERIETAQSITSGPTIARTIHHSVSLFLREARERERERERESSGNVAVRSVSDVKGVMEISYQT